MRDLFKKLITPFTMHDGDTLPAPLALGAAAIFVGLASVIFSPAVIVAVAGIIAITILAFLRPAFVIGALAVYTPFEPFLLKFAPDEIYVYARYFSEGLIYLVALVVAYRLLVGTAKFRSTPIDLPFVFFLLVALSSLVINAVPPVIGLLGLRQIIRFIILFYAAVYLDVGKRYVRLITAVLLGIMVLQVVVGLSQALAGGRFDEFLLPSERRFFESVQLTTGVEQTWAPGTRIFATMGRYDQLGTFLSFFMLIALGLMYRVEDAVNRKKYLWLALLAVPALVLTLSRASWFGFALGLFVIGAWLMKDWRIKAAYASIAIMALLYIGATGLAVRYLVDYPEQGLVERFFEAFSYERWRGEYFGLGRLYWIVQTPAVVVKSSPVFGVGPGQYGAGAVAALGNETVYERLNLPFGVYGTEGYIDNNWFALWGETGTLGFVFYVWMYLALARMALVVALHSKDLYMRGIALGYVGCMVAVAFQAFLGTYLEVRTLALYLWLYGAFIVAAAKREGLKI